MQPEDIDPDPETYEQREDRHAAERREGEARKELAELDRAMPGAVKEWESVTSGTAEGTVEAEWGSMPAASGVALSLTLDFTVRGSTAHDALQELSVLLGGTDLIASLALSNLRIAKAEATA